MLVAGGNGDLAAGEVGHDLAVGDRSGAAADEQQAPIVGTRRAGVERVEPVEQAAHDPFERGPGQRLSRDVGADARRSVPVASGRFGVRSPAR